MTELLKKFKPLFRYLVFGILTMVVNIVIYTVCFHYLLICNVTSNIIAWIVAVAFAFITNKIWVFESKLINTRALAYELLTFFGCRLLTGIFDLAVMFISVDVFGLNAVITKTISNIAVTVLNYVASKFFIFRT